MARSKYKRKNIHNGRVSLETIITFQDALKTIEKGKVVKVNSNQLNGRQSVR